MRFKLRLKSLNDTPVKVDIDYRRRFISLLKKIFKDEYVNNAVKPHTFAVYFGKGTKITKDFIEGVSHINFRFSTGDFIWATKFYNGALELKEGGEIHSIGEGRFIIDSIEQEREKTPTGVFRTLSPVIVERPRDNSQNSERRNPEDRYIVPPKEGFSEEFNKSLLESIIKRYRYINMKSPKVGGFRFTSLWIKKEFIKHYGGYIKGFRGYFRIETDSKDILNFVYLYGLGFRTGQGFGYLEVEDIPNE